MYKKPESLDEKLEKASKLEMRRLSRQINEDPELKRMLTTPMEEIPQYHYLYSTELPHLGKQSLLDAIKFMLEYEHRSNLFFSKAGFKFTGFVVYEDNGKVINSVKMASFLDDKKSTNTILAKDLIEFVLDMAPQRNVIEWYVDPNNAKAIRQYNAVLTRKGMNWQYVKDGKMIKYAVKGKKA